MVVTYLVAYPKDARTRRSKDSSMRRDDTVSLVQLLARTAQMFTLIISEAPDAKLYSVYLGIAIIRMVSWL